MRLNNAVRIIQEESDHRANSLSYVPTCEDTGSLAASVHCFMSSPIFCEWRDQNLDFVPFGEVIQSVERLLKSFVGLYDGYSQHLASLQSDMIMQDTASTDSVPSSSYDISKSRIVDMELDVNDDSRDADSLLVVKKIGSGVSSSVEKWKVGMISLISCFFYASPVLTWNTLFKLMEEEYDPKVDSTVIFSLQLQTYYFVCY